MARQTLATIGRATRSGTVTSPEFVVPADLPDGYLRLSGDVVPNQRTDSTRAFTFGVYKRLEDGTWDHVNTLGWRGNPGGVLPAVWADVTEVLGYTLVGRLIVAPGVSVNAGGTVEWMDRAEGDA